MNNLMLDVDQAGELKAAFRRHNYTNTLIKRMCEGDALGQFKLFLAGTHQITPIPVPTISIDRSRPFNPVEFIGAGFKMDPNEPEDQNSLVLTEFDLKKVRFEHMLKEGEESITGEKKLQRLKARDNFVRADAKFGQTLFEDWQKNGENSMLEYLRKTRGVTWMDFPGTVLQGSGVRRCVLYLRWSGGCWSWRCLWLVFDWGADNPSLVFGK